MFRIKKLVIAGENKKNASIDFTDGVNYIVGPSNKGKSFIYECLRYMLGSSKTPKEIPESKGYTEIYLEITENSRISTIHRSLKDGNKARIFYSDFDNLNIDSSVEVKLKSESASLSQFYLDKIKYPLAARIRSNASNAKKRLTYNSIKSLFAISEKDIVSEDSYHFDFNSKSYFLGILKYIFTGLDDIALKEIDEEKIFRAKKLAKIDLLRDIINSHTNKIRQLEGSLSIIDFSKEEESKRIILGKLEEINLVAEDYLDDYQETNNLLVKISEKISNERLAKKRLENLRFNYNNDIVRLSAMMEGVNFIGQLLDEQCPICGSNIHIEHGSPQKTEDYIMGARQEADKIRRNLLEVNKMIEYSEDNVSNLILESNNIKIKIESYNKKKNEVGLEKYSAEEELRAVFENYRLRNELDHLKFEVDKYTKMILEFDSQEKEILSHTYEIPVESLEFIESRISRILKLWGIKSGEIDFNFDSVDFSINGVKRKSNGKGVRGILNFALAISILEMSFFVKRPFSGFLIVDSPFTNFRQDQTSRGVDNLITQRIEAKILKDLVKNHNRTQFIIMENKEGFGEENIQNLKVISLLGQGFIPSE